MLVYKFRSAGCVSRLIFSGETKDCLKYPPSGCAAISKWVIQSSAFIISSSIPYYFFLPQINETFQLFRRIHYITYPYKLNDRNQLSNYHCIHKRYGANQRRLPRDSEVPKSTRAFSPSGFRRKPVGKRS